MASTKQPSQEPMIPKPVTEAQEAIAQPPELPPAEPPKAATAKAEGAPKKVRLTPRGGFAIRHINGKMMFSPGIFSPPVEIDPWIQSQISAGTLRVVE